MPFCHWKPVTLPAYETVTSPVPKWSAPRCVSPWHPPRPSPPPHSDRSAPRSSPARSSRPHESTPPSEWCNWLLSHLAILPCPCAIGRSVPAGRCAGESGGAAHIRKPRGRVQRHHRRSLVIDNGQRMVNWLPKIAGPVIVCELKVHGLRRVEQQILKDRDGDRFARLTRREPDGRSADRVILASGLGGRS